MKKVRRIRCFKCRELVLPDFDCSNSGAEYSVVKFTIGGNRGCICSKCIEECGSDWSYAETEAYQRQLESHNTSVATQKSDDVAIASPVQEKLTQKYDCLNNSLAFLQDTVKKTVFGQDEAVEKVVYSIYLNQLVNMLEDGGTSFEPTVNGGASGFKRRHMLLIGDTGTGKTLLATTAAKVFGVPYSISNATPLTSAGYIGEDVEQVLERLYVEAGNDIERAENGILILDEIDKKRHEPATYGRDVSGKSVQQELLKILEPSTVWINHHSVPFRTDNLTVIMMGAFVGLDDIISKRTKDRRIGFSNAPKASNLKTDVQLEDLIEYGFIPEFVGRLLCTCKLNKLDVDIVKKIIRGVIEKYEVIFKAKKFEINVSELLIQNLAEDIVKSSTGARNVEFRLNDIMMPALTKVLQSSIGGICEILDDGDVRITSYSTQKKAAKTEKISEDVATNC